MATPHLKMRKLPRMRSAASGNEARLTFITGIRRCGKTCLLKQMAQRLRDEGIPDNCIIEMNFGSFELRKMTAAELVTCVLSSAVPGARIHLFFDEIQKIRNWEQAVLKLLESIDCEIRVTALSTARTYANLEERFGGNYAEYPLLPLSFKEFVEFRGLGSKDKTEAFEEYLIMGGIPLLADPRFSTSDARAMLEGIVAAITLLDVLGERKSDGECKIAEPRLMQMIIRYLADTVGCGISVTRLGNILKHEGLIDECNIPSGHTVQSYVNAITAGGLFYKVKRLDLKTGRILKTMSRYYIVDPGFRYTLLGPCEPDGGHALENIVYLELRRRGYSVFSGKLGAHEMDFVATAHQETLYVQVAHTLDDPEVLKRKTSPLAKIPDHGEKLVLSLNPGSAMLGDGIKAVNLIDWLLEN